MTDNVELKDFVKKTIEEIKEGLPEGFSIEESISFELSVQSEGKAKAGFNVSVIGGNVSKTTQNLHKIKFNVADDSAIDRKFEKGKKVIIDFFRELTEIDPNFLLEDKSKEN